MRIPKLPQKFMTSGQLEKQCQRLYGLEYHEALEMAYDTIREYCIDYQKQIHRLDKALAKMEQRERKLALHSEGKE